MSIQNKGTLISIKDGLEETVSLFLPSDSDESVPSFSKDI